MSSAANHRARSCRSAYRHRSATSGMARRNVIRGIDRRTGQGRLINRLMAFRRQITEAKVRRKAEPNEG